LEKPQNPNLKIPKSTAEDTKTKLSSKQHDNCKCNVSLLSKYLHIPLIAVNAYIPGKKIYIFTVAAYVCDLVIPKHFGWDR